MTAIFLVMNYLLHQMVSINALINNDQAEVHAFSYKINRLIEIKPDIMVVAGWAVPDFVWATKKFAKI